MKPLTASMTPQHSSDYGGLWIDYMQCSKNMMVRFPKIVCYTRLMNWQIHWANP
jgi:hypothetical protein